MARYDLTDFEWSVIEPLLPQKSRGVPRVDDRRVLNGIFWVLRSGAPWADLREHLEPLFSTLRERSMERGLIHVNRGRHVVRYAGH